MFWSEVSICGQRSQDENWLSKVPFTLTIIGESITQVFHWPAIYWARFGQDWLFSYSLQQNPQVTKQDWILFSLWAFQSVTEFGLNLDCILTELGLNFDWVLTEFWHFSEALQYCGLAVLKKFSNLNRDWSLETDTKMYHKIYQLTHFSHRVTDTNFYPRVT